MPAQALIEALLAGVLVEVLVVGLVVGLVELPEQLAPVQVVVLAAPQALFAALQRVVKLIAPQPELAESPQAEWRRARQREQALCFSVQIQPLSSHF